MSTWPIVRIPVNAFRGGDPDLVWWGGGDGKPRCARHRGTCLIKARTVGVGTNDHDYLCAVILATLGGA